MPINCLSNKNFQLGIDCLSSKPAIAVSLILEITSIVIGILAVIHIIPGVELIPAAFITGTGGLFLILTISLASYRYCKKTKQVIDISNQKSNKSFNSISQSPVNTESSVNTESPENTQKSVKVETEPPKNISQVSQSPTKTSAPIAPQKPVEKGPLLDIKLVSLEDCLNALCFLIKDETSHLFKTLNFVSEPSNNVQALIQEGQNKKGNDLYHFIVKEMTPCMSSLMQFLNAETQKILLLKDATEDTRQTFQRVNRQMRMLLLFLMSHARDKKGDLTKYEKHLTTSLGNRAWATDDFNYPCWYYSGLQRLLTKNDWSCFKKVLLAFSLYRRHSLIRLFPEKINKITQCMDAQLNTLLRATWFHGTRAVTCLPESNFTLIPTGELVKQGRVIFFGETSAGCQKNGVNKTALSGTCLDHVDWSLDTYATGFQFDIAKEIKRVEEFLKIDEEVTFSCSGFIFSNDRMPIQIYALKRFALWDRDAFQKRLPEIQAKFQRLKNLIVKIEQDRPREIFSWRDTYYSRRYEDIKYGLEQLETFLTNLPTPLTQEQKDNVTNNFPAVLGSFTLFTEPYRFDDQYGEYELHSTAQMGEDLQLLCVDDGNLKTAQEWLRKHHLDDSVSLFSFSQLRDAYKLNQKISPYLADFFSVKKFRKVCT